MKRVPPLGRRRRPPPAAVRRSPSIGERFPRAAALLALAGLTGGCSLAGDVTPPPAVATAQAAVPVPTSPAVTDVRVPDAAADLAVGERLYADRCAACHGPAGEGDGELAGELTFPPAALGDPELARAAAPEAWFQVVTNGRLDRLMPPFPSLSDQQRWDVVGYALSLSTSGEQLQLGQALFEEFCTECHAASDFELGLLQEASRRDHFALIGEGRDQMPGFGSALEDEQLWALAGYLQSLAWAVGAPSQSAVAEPATSRTTVTGRVINGTDGAELPDELQVQIVAFDGVQQVLDELVPVDSQGDFRLEEVETAPGRLFFATLEYQQVPFRSEVAHAPADGSSLELPLTIYDTSADPAPIRVERLHLLIDFPEPGVMRVLQLWVVGNASDRVVTPSLRVPLPAQASNLGFEEGDLGGRYQRTAEGFIDQEALPPGSGIDQLVFGFDLPWERAFDYRQPLEHPVQALIVLVSEEGPRLSGLTDEGVRDLGGLRMRSYAAAGFASGDSLAFRVAGPGGLSGSATTLAVGAAALLIALLVVIRAGSARPAATAPPRPAATANEQALLRAIAQLDAEYEAGRLDRARWEQRRATLKQQALAMMRDEGG